MLYAIECNFDAVSEQKIVNLWKKLEEIGITTPHSKALRPHITLSIGEADDLELICENFKPICSVEKPFPITFNHIGIFPNKELVLYLGLNVTAEIVAWHQKVNNLLLCYLENPWSYYLPDNWTPHCTLSDNVQPELIPEAITQAKALPLPMEVTVSGMSVHTLDPVKYLKSFVLKVS